MSFLSAVFLVALPLAAAPIVLHLFDRRRSVPIPWGAMQFLLEAATRKTRARRFQHWLLLLLRVLSVAAVVLVLARPLVPGGWFGVVDRREAILLVDNSMSVRQRLGEGSAYDALLARAEEVLDGLDPGSTVRILASSPYPAWVTPTAVRVDAGTRPQLAGLLRGIVPTLGTSDIPAALLKTIQTDAQAERLIGRRIFLFTDGQRKDWRMDDRLAWSRFKAAMESARVSTGLEVIEPRQGPPGAANVAIVQLRSNRTLVGVNQPFSITGKAQNLSSQAAPSRAARWLVDEEPQSADTLPALAAGETRDVAWQHSFAKPGAYRITCRLDAGDDLSADDDDSIVIEVVDRVPVLLVESAERLAEMQQDSYLVRAALGRIDGDELAEWRAVFEPHTIPPQQLESIRLNDFDAVVIPSVTELTPRAVERLAEFVAGGGGLWLALGPRTNVDTFNKLLFQDGSGLSPAPLSRIVDEPSDDFMKPVINTFQKSHPATADLADNERLDTGDVKVSRRFRFQMPEDGMAISVLLDLSNGEPLVVENRVGKGRVIVQAIPLRYQWSELAVSQAFVVMVHDWLSYLVEPKRARHNLLPGDSLSVQVAGIDETHATLTTPIGADVAVAGEPIAEGVFFRTSHTSWPGNYALDLGLVGSKIPFHVARDAGESDLTPLTAEDRTWLGEVAGLHGGRTLTHAPGTIQVAPAWPTLSILLIALMVGEFLLSGAISRKRFGVPEISETAGTITAEEAFPASIASGRQGAQSRKIVADRPVESRA